jgi:hypothetical protein
MKAKMPKTVTPQQIRQHSAVLLFRFRLPGVGMTARRPLKVELGSSLTDRPWSTNSPVGAASTTTPANAL